MMFQTLYQYLRPAPFTQRWLARHATARTRADFETHARAIPAVPIYHVTSAEAAQSMHRSGSIFGIDVVSSAHFHHRPAGAHGQSAADGMLLGFCWDGEVRKVDLSHDASSHRDRRPNILFDVPISETRRDTWELRLYPGTSGLELAFIEVARRGYLLRQPRQFTVIAAD